MRPANDEIEIRIRLGYRISSLRVKIVANFEPLPKLSFLLYPLMRSLLCLKIEHVSQLLSLLFIVLLLVHVSLDGVAPRILGYQMRHNGLVKTGALFKQRFCQCAHFHAVQLLRVVLDDQAVEELEDGQQVLCKTSQGE